MMLKKAANLVVVCSVAFALVVSGCSSDQKKPVGAAEKYPTKTVTMIVPFPAGGGSDLMARAMEKVSAKNLGQPLVVVNKPGGSATIGWNELAESKPDGYTIGITNLSIALMPLYGDVKHNYPEELEPIAQATTIPIAVVVLSDQPWKNANDLIQYAKANPGKIKYGTAGLGTSTHVAAEMFAQVAGIKIEHVPFRGGSESLTAFLGGHIQLLFASFAEVTPFIKQGKVTPLAIAEEKRLTDDAYKNIPTFRDQGIDVVFNIWQGVGGPKGMSADVKNKLAESFKAIINEPSFKKSATDLGMNVEYLGPKEFGEKWQSESARFKKIVKETGIAERIASQKKQ